MTSTSTYDTTSIAALIDVIPMNSDLYRVACVQLQFEDWTHGFLFQEHSTFFSADIHSFVFTREDAEALRDELRPIVYLDGWQRVRAHDDDRLFYAIRQHNFPLLRDDLYHRTMHTISARGTLIFFAATCAALLHFFKNNVTINPGALLEEQCVHLDRAHTLTQHDQIVEHVTVYRIHEYDKIVYGTVVLDEQCYALYLLRENHWTSIG